MANPKLQPHQKEALSKLHNGSILWGAPGSGKSRVGLAYYINHEAPKDIVVITTAKVRDSSEWETEAAKWTIGTSADATWYGVLTVDSWNNLSKYVDRNDCFFIFDEQRLVGSGTWVKAFLKIAKDNNWILLSATPGDTWMDYLPVFVANGFYRNRSEFKREHVVYKPYTKYPKVDRYLGVQKLVRLRSEILVKMPFDQHTIRWDHDEFVGFDDVMMSRVMTDRWNPFEDRPIKDVAEMFYLMRKVVNSDPERLVVLDRIIEKRRRVIVFYNFDYELAMLRGLSEVIPFAEWNGHKHEEIPSTDRWVYAVQYNAGSEGWNCIETDTIVFWSLTYSYKMWEQAHGRIDRMDSPYINLHYHKIRTRSKIDNLIWKALSEKRNFQQSDFPGYSNEG